ncbi:helix-turn-helix domain-containing protein [Candidatus Woesearchaeota archaeon]|nr:helix-turn-helix domain-containing protein [Candidatus Woesearchaeota archaeon]
MEEILKETGLTNSEIKVYLALLRKGPLTKTPLIKESKISSSKVYEVINKLISKGLVSVVIKNDVKHFDAASPLKIKEYLEIKKNKIIIAEDKVNKILPELINIKNTKVISPEISVFYGWEGLGSVYQTELGTIKKNSKVYVIGASTGKNLEMTKIFFTKYGRIAFSKNLDTYVIFNINAREYAKSIEKNIGKMYKKRFLFNYTPTEITIANDTTIINILREEPIVIRIINRETAQSFITYFKAIWKIAKK